MPRARRPTTPAGAAAAGPDLRAGSSTAAAATGFLGPEFRAFCVCFFCAHASGVAKRFPEGVPGLFFTPPLALLVARCAAFGRVRVVAAVRVIGVPGRDR